MTLDARETTYYAGLLQIEAGIGRAAVLLIGSYIDCMRVFTQAVGQESYEMPSLGGSSAALERVAIDVSNANGRVWLTLTDVDRWIQTQPQHTNLMLKMFFAYQKRVRGFPLVATASAMTPELIALFQTRIHLEPLSGSGRTPRRFHTREAFDAEEDTFDGLMGLPSFRRRQR